MTAAADTANLRLGDTAPDFTADSTIGKLEFHKWLGDSWGVFFSHPKDFTPVCTTELGEAAKRSADFKRRGVKVLALSVDSSESHNKWKGDIEETQSCTVDFPIVGDDAKQVATPVNWKDGQDVIIPPAIQDPEELKKN